MHLYYGENKLSQVVKCGMVTATYLTWMARIANKREWMGLQIIENGHHFVCTIP